MALAGSERFLKFLLFVDVENDSAEVAGYSVLTVDGAAARANPVVLSVAALYPVLNIEAAAGCDGLLYGLLGCLPVLRFEEGEKQRR